MKIRNKPICRWLTGILAAVLLLVPATFAQAAEALDQTGTVTTSEIKKIATGSNHTVALKNDGTVWTWGYNQYSKLGYAGDGTSPMPVSFPSIDPDTGAFLGNAIDVGAGDDYSIALFANGTVWAWGHNYWGTLGNPTVTSETANPVKVYVAAGVPLTGITWVNIAKILAYLKTAPDKDIDGSGVYDAVDVRYLLRLIDTMYVPDYSENPV